MRNVVINARFLTQQITGVQRFAIELSKRIKEFYPGIEFVAPFNIKQKQLAKDLNVKVIGFYSGHLWEQLDLVNYLKSKSNPLLICLANTAPLYYKKKIVAIHDLAWKHLPQSVSKKFYFWYLFMTKRIASSSIHFITVSNFSKKDISKNLGIPKNKITVIYNGVADAFKNMNLKREKNILYVGSLNRYKNVDRLIRAFIFLKENFKEDLQGYKLTIIGRRNTKVFKDIPLVDNNKDIIFKGYKDTEELVYEYNKAQIFVLPSIFESFGITGLEAMACGCPVVASNIESLREVYKEAAVYIDPLSYKSIAWAIYKLIKDAKLRNKLVERGEKRALMFNWRDSTKKLKTIIEGLDENSASS